MSNINLPSTIGFTNSHKEIKKAFVARVVQILKSEDLELKNYGINEEAWSKAVTEQLRLEVPEFTLNIQITRKTP